MSLFNCVRLDFKDIILTRHSILEVVITTPEMLVTDDFKELAAIDWEILVVDEAHRKYCAHKLLHHTLDLHFTFLCNPPI